MAARTLSRIGALALACALLGGCGSTHGAPTRAGARTLALGWSETLAGGGKPVLRFRVDRLRVTPAGWTVFASFANRSRTRFLVSAGSPAESLFGVAVFRSTSPAEALRTFKDPTVEVDRASNFVPRPPAVLEPGAVWKGRFSGSGALARGRYLRVVFGIFTSIKRAPPGLHHTDLNWVTDHVVRL